jgi:hypothetical protein
MQLFPNRARLQVNLAVLLWASLFTRMAVALTYIPEVIKTA